MNDFVSTQLRALAALLLLTLIAMPLWATTVSSQGPEEEAPVGSAEEERVTAPSAPSATIFSYQGQLLDGNGSPISNAAMPMSFKLYDVATGGTACWSEDHTAINVSDGLFHVLLGQITAIDSACLTNDAYLELVVDSETLSPRELLTSVAHAVEAGTLTDGATTQGTLTLAGTLNMGVHDIDAGDPNGDWGGENFQITNSYGSVRLRATDSLLFFIDTDNDNTDREFKVVKDSDSFGGSVTEIFKVVESGDITAHGNLVMSGNLLHINSDGDGSTGQIKFQNNDYITFDDLTNQPGSFSFDVDESTGNAFLLAGAAYLNTGYDSNYKLKAGGSAYVGGNLTINGTGQSIINNAQDVDDSGTAALRFGSGTNWLGIDNNEIAAFGDPLYLQRSDATTEVIIGTSLKVEQDAQIDGNVGIGTTSPSEKLEVAGNVSLMDYELLNVRSLQLKDWDDNTGGTDKKYRVLARDGAWQFYNGGVVIGHYDNGTWGDLADGNLIVKSKVGIGTTSPNNTLDVAGTLDVSERSYLNGITLDADADITGADEIVGHNDIRIYGDSSGGPDIYVAQDGNVGIGTTVPGSYKLNVEGNLRVAGTCSASTANGESRAGLPTDATCSTGSITTDELKADSISSGAYIETNLQTPEERGAGGNEEFSEGDLLCWQAESQKLALCSTANDRLVMAVADPKGKPIVIGAEPIKVIGTVKAGDILVASDVPGYAMVNNNPLPGTVMAQALEDFDGEKGLIKAMIRKW